MTPKIRLGMFALASGLLFHNAVDLYKDLRQTKNHTQVSEQDLIKTIEMVLLAHPELSCKPASK